MLNLTVPGLAAPLRAAYAEFREIALSNAPFLGAAETPLGASSPDPKRYLEFGVQDSDIPETLRALRLFLLGTLDRCAQALEPVLLQPLDTPLRELIDRDTGPILRLSWYPEGYIGEVNQPHTDIDLFTVLPAASTVGLERRVEHAWLPVSIADDEIVVMPGDILHELGAAQAIEHRVFGGGAERISASLFVNASPSVAIDTNVQAGELLKQRLEAVRLIGEDHG
ncbi:2OG-Fe(II) oxygenase family protein [Sphingobium sp. CFD-1]|uniref:2OG-Fe(II) oxygenase family protein n=1 Tax=Sphingobium sp. CFD-1 TaxID=2878545 RepID=UPI00214C5619|nr:2OG-Fe(II) oxygenase family protein [Sphingobium sp. CFD-1]